MNGREGIGGGKWLGLGFAKKRTRNIWERKKEQHASSECFVYFKKGCVFLGQACVFIYLSRGG